jgi:hypothetical protein
MIISTTMDEAGQRFGNAGAIHDARCEHAAMAENALERERDQEEEQDAQKAGIEDRLECIPLRILEFARVADRGLEAVGRPCCDVETAEEQGPAADRPHAIDAGIGCRRRHEAGDVGAVDIARDDRVDADQQQRHEHDDRQPFLHACRAGDAAMLDRKDDQHQEAADEERGVEVGGCEIGNVEACQRPGA